MSTKAEIILR